MYAWRDIDVDVDAALQSPLPSASLSSTFNGNCLGAFLSVNAPLDADAHAQQLKLTERERESERETVNGRAAPSLITIGIINCRSN